MIATMRLRTLNERRVELETALAEARRAHLAALIGLLRGEIWAQDRVVVQCRLIKQLEDELAWFDGAHIRARLADEELASKQDTTDQ